MYRTSHQPEHNMQPIGLISQPTKKENKEHAWYWVKENRVRYEKNTHRNDAAVSKQRRTFSPPFFLVPPHYGQVSEGRRKHPVNIVHRRMIDFKFSEPGLLRGIMNAVVEELYSFLWLNFSLILPKKLVRFFFLSVVEDAAGLSALLLLGVLVAGASFLAGVVGATTAA